MSVFTIEQVLFEVASSPDRTDAYKAGRNAFLQDYPLGPDEIPLIQELDVREMIRRGVNPMLAMRAFMAIEGRAAMTEYYRRLREV